MPHNVQAAPDEKTVWATVPNMSGIPDLEDEVYVIDAADYSILAQIPVGIGTHPAHVILDPQGRFAYVALNITSQILKIDAKSYAVVDTFKLLPRCKPHGLRMGGNRLIIANTGADSLTMIDLTNSSVHYIPVGGKQMQAAVASDGSFAVVTLHEKAEVVKYFPVSGQIVHIDLQDAQGPIQCYLTPDNSQLYVCDQGMIAGSKVSDKLYIADMKTDKVTHVLKTGSQCHGVVISGDGKFAYTTNQGDNTVSVIRTSVPEVIKTIPVGFFPNGITWLSN
jgi:YVTN family beta-propeller protein